MKTLLLSISLSFSLLASAQIPQFAVNCADDNEGVNATEIKTGPPPNGTPWNYSNNKDKAYYNGVLYTGIIKVCGKNTGKVMSKLSYKNGIKDGLSYKYHKEGWLQWKKNYANGKEDGHQKYFYPSDMMAMNNNTPGKTADLNLNRRIKESYLAVNGKKDGKARAFYANDTIKYLEFYELGKMHGDQLYYYESGMLERKEHYVNGVKDGDQMYYDEKKNLIGEESWENGKQVSGYKLYTGVIKVIEREGVLMTQEDKKISLCVWYKDLGNMKWNVAKKECEDLGDGWRLPTRHEVDFLYEYKNEIGGFDYQKYYWSNWEWENPNCTVKGAKNFSSVAKGDWNGYCDGDELKVRPVRTLNP
jgi:antitoxin component YwqK of YwqJK toxin-antitoxin module